MSVERSLGSRAVAALRADDLLEFRRRIARARAHAETLYDEVTSIASDLAEDGQTRAAFQAELSRLRILVAHRGLEEAARQL